MQVKATAKGLPTSSRKFGLVAALVRGRSVTDATTILEHTPKSAARMLKEVVKSAVANAENNHKQPAANLKIDEILVGPAPTVKRFRAGSRGTIRPQRHRHSNVTVIIGERDKTSTAKKEKK
jgi:large subunit ribosomal protein L22